MEGWSSWLLRESFFSRLTLMLNSYSVVELNNAPCSNGLFSSMLESLTLGDGQIWTRCSGRLCLVVAISATTSIETIYSTAKPDAMQP